MHDSYALVLVALNDDLTDGAGNQYVEKGRVECEEYEQDDRLDRGLFGILWGATSDPIVASPYSNTDGNKWAVVRVEVGDEVVPLDESHGIVKFRDGQVVCLGDLKACAGYIKDHSDDRIATDVVSEQIGGTEVEADALVIHEGFRGRAISKQVGAHAIATGIDSEANALQCDTHAIALAGHSRAVAADDYSVALTTGRNSRSRACGDDSIALATGLSSQAICSGRNGIALCRDGVGAAGEDGILILGYVDDDGRQRVKVGYVGEDIEAGKLYEVKDGEFEETDDLDFGRRSRKVSNLRVGSDQDEVAKT